MHKKAITIEARCWRETVDLLGVKDSMAPPRKSREVKRKDNLFKGQKQASVFERKVVTAVTYGTR